MHTKTPGFTGLERQFYRQFSRSRSSNRISARTSTGRQTSATTAKPAGVVAFTWCRARATSMTAGARRDARIGRALELIHEAPARPWSIDGLACVVGMSRSAFAGRFKALVDEGPMQYLTRWRMHRAAHHLRAEGLAVPQTAARVGYESSATFSKAFKRYMGSVPATYRRSSGGPPVIHAG